MALSNVISTPLWSSQHAQGEVRASSGLSKSAPSLFQRLFAPLFSKESQGQDNSCYSRLNEKYPDMDSNSRTIVQILCNNLQTSISTTGPLYFSDQGANAIGEALQQNTAVESFDLIDVGCLDPDRDCQTTLATAISSALTINRAVKELSVPFTSSSSMAPQTFLRSLPCYNLDSLTLFNAELSASGALDFSNAIQSHPYFPLKNLTWMGLNQDPSIPQEMTAIGNSRCIDTLDLSNVFFTQAQYVNLFQDAIGNSKLGHVFLPDVPLFPTPILFTSDQVQSILSGVANNPCFLSYTLPTSYAAFSPSLIASIQNITQGRTPCLPDPQCLVPASCYTPPTPPPTPTPSPSIDGFSTTTLVIAAAAAAVGAVILTSLACLACQKYRPMRPAIPLSDQLH